MKHVSKLIYLFLIVSFITSCNNQSRNEEVIEEVMEEETAADIMKIIDAKNAEIVAHYKAGNIDEAAKHFADNVMQFPPNDAPISGIEEYKARWKESIGMGSWTFDLQVQEVKKSGDLAVERGTYTLGFEPNEGAPMPAFMDEGNYLVLWEKIDGDWKILWDAPVSTVPMPMPGGE
ncbi:YybH family protein [Fulvivirga sedimenti]|uniref:DUF4440 domain-containing protein n=1 Tax=Fulvivirga sedimenti TaxID=2879465 RepID=A0A9X1HMD3_9BACT|nr:DUF4440 domain-containing protein [Fulvivirga sedimenti]MCA6073242.1 DUF4440 domain-containing protein [Fulvivirga sedimenti]